jgi:hypothetical protein
MEPSSAQSEAKCRQAVIAGPARPTNRRVRSSSRGEPDRRTSVTVTALTRSWSETNTAVAWPITSIRASLSNGGSDHPRIVQPDPDAGGDAVGHLRQALAAAQVCHHLEPAGSRYSALVPVLSDGRRRPWLAGTGQGPGLRDLGVATHHRDDRVGLAGCQDPVRFHRGRAGRPRAHPKAPSLELQEQSEPVAAQGIGVDPRHEVRGRRVERLRHRWSQRADRPGVAHVGWFHPHRRPGERRRAHGQHGQQRDRGHLGRGQGGAPGRQLQAGGPQHRHHEQAGEHPEPLHQVQEPGRVEAYRPVPGAPEQPRQHHDRAAAARPPAAATPVRTEIAHPAKQTPDPGTTDAEIRRVPNSQFPTGSSCVSQIRVPARSPITSIGLVAVGLQQDRHVARLVADLVDAPAGSTITNAEDQHRRADPAEPRGTSPT